MLIPTSNESHLRTQCANKEGESIPSLEPTPAAWRTGSKSTPPTRWSDSTRKSDDGPVVGIFPNEASIRRLIGAVLMEQNEEWQPRHRFCPTTPCPTQ